MSNTRFNGRLKVAFSLSLYFDDISMTFPFGLLIRGVLYLSLSWCLFPDVVLVPKEGEAGGKKGEKEKGREEGCYMVLTPAGAVVVLCRSGLVGYVWDVSAGGLWC